MMEDRPLFTEDDLRRIEGLASKLITKVHQIPLNSDTLTAERLKEAKVAHRELNIAMRSLKARRLW